VCVCVLPRRAPGLAGEHKTRPKTNYKISPMAGERSRRAPSKLAAAAASAVVAPLSSNRDETKQNKTKTFGWRAAFYEPSSSLRTAAAAATFRIVGNAK
jgi:hypothetical protein